MILFIFSVIRDNVFYPICSNHLGWICLQFYHSYYGEIAITSHKSYLKFYSTCSNSVSMLIFLNIVGFFFNLIDADDIRVSFLRLISKTK